MAKPKTNIEAFERVTDIVKKVHIAEALRLTRQAVSNWKNGVPEIYAYRVSVMTGIRIEDILPEVAPEVHKRLKELADAKAKAQQNRRPKGT